MFGMDRNKGVFTIMARIPRTVVQVDRLRDQVYALILDDLKVGMLEPGSRLVEGELAKRYNVSRTPVREALFQLSRDGLLSPAERGYVVAEDDSQMTADRHEVRELIDPRLAYHAAVEGTASQRKALEKLHKGQCAAHEAGDLDKFIRANVEFRSALRSMCRNGLLARCSQLLDDQAQPARRAIFSVPEYRALEIEYEGKVMEAVIAGDPARAEAEMRSYIDTVRKNLKYVLEDAAPLNAVGGAANDDRPKASKAEATA
ncbi:MAG: GntR family transcriptional regulator [Sphingomonadales bacterium]|nr:MAG: GntR family transcriptional regulator [Sphingomonadales bacterium]TNF03046.1 MAG: GntR family transcriptional regulator [Sphingomonadales bacterium]